jgi:helicase
MGSLVPQRSIIQRREKPGSQSVITPLARQIVAKGEKPIVFRNYAGTVRSISPVNWVGAQPLRL